MCGGGRRGRGGPLLHLALTLCITDVLLVLVVALDTNVDRNFTTHIVTFIGLVAAPLGPAMWLWGIENKRNVGYHGMMMRLSAWIGFTLWMSIAMIWTNSNCLYAPCVVGIVYITLAHVDAVLTASTSILPMNNNNVKHGTSSSQQEQPTWKFFMVWVITSMIISCILAQSPLPMILCLPFLVSSFSYMRQQQQQLHHIQTRQPVPSFIPSTECNSEATLREINLALSSLAPQVVARLEGMKINFENVELHERIGQGAFGEVLRGQWQGNVIAVKRIPKSKVSFESIRAAMREIELSQQLAHPNIVKLVAWCVEPYVCLCTEYMNHGSLHDFLKTSSAAQFEPGTWTSIKTRLAVDVGLALVFLHGKGYIHRDIKTDNLLVSSVNATGHMVCKISDFGCLLHISQLPFATRVGSSLWMAPELFQPATTTPPYNEKIDVWAFGLCLIEIFTHLDPYRDQDGNSTFNSIKVSEGDVSPLSNLPHDVPAALSNILAKCCEFHVKRRADIRTVLFTLLEMLVQGDDEDHVEVPLSHEFITLPACRITSSKKRRITTPCEQNQPLDYSPGNPSTTSIRISDPTSERKRKNTRMVLFDSPV